MLERSRVTPRGICRRHIGSLHKNWGAFVSRVAALRLSDYFVRVPELCRGHICFDALYGFGFLSKSRQSRQMTRSPEPRREVCRCSHCVEPGLLGHAEHAEPHSNKATPPGSSLTHAQICCETRPTTIPVMIIMCSLCLRYLGSLQILQGFKLHDEPLRLTRSLAVCRHSTLLCTALLLPGERCGCIETAIGRRSVCVASTSAFPKVASMSYSRTVSFTGPDRFEFAVES